MKVLIQVEMVPIEVDCEIKMDHCTTVFWIRINHHHELRGSITAGHRYYKTKNAMLPCVNIYILCIAKTMKELNKSNFFL